MHWEQLKVKRQLKQNNDSRVQEPAIHIRRITSDDTVMKSGKDCDNITKLNSIIAFEMKEADV